MNRLLLFQLLLLLLFNCVICRVKNQSNTNKKVCSRQSGGVARFKKCQNWNHKGNAEVGGVTNAQNCMDEMSSILKSGNCSDTIRAIEKLERILKETKVNKLTKLSANGLVALMYKVSGSFKGLPINADEHSVCPGEVCPKKKVSVQLPEELDVQADNTIVFCMLTWSKHSEVRDAVLRTVHVHGQHVTSEDRLYEDRLVGLSVRGKNISNLQEGVNITINLSSEIKENQTLSCVFLNFASQTFSQNGCTTTWERGQSSITCSCDHLTYFGVLVGVNPPSAQDQKILTYISMIGCSLSLVGLVLTLLLFILNRKSREDASVKIHLNLSVALILLNVFFLCSQAAASSPSSGLCLWVALSLHYSLLVTFGWMALEGFHLYLLLVKVFNIYVRRYLLKLSLVGWGVPAVIVSLVVIIDRNSYGPVSLDSSNSESTSVCYIANRTVTMVTTVGVISCVFVFNVVILAVTIRRFVSLHTNKELGQRNYSRAKQDICSLLGIVTLLGVTWGLVFFSFGQLGTAGLYLFCVLNSLQGFFIFLWFVMSMKKSGNSTPKISSVTRSTNS